MNAKKLRNLAFSLHRYIGLAVGLILIIVGLTGSLLVFQREIDHFLVNLRMERVVPLGKRNSLETVLNLVKRNYVDSSNLKIESIDLPQKPESPYQVWLKSKDDKWTGVYINPYTGKILGTRQWEKTLIGIAYDLHYRLLAGEVGTIIVGIAALLLFFLCISGLILWPGWRKLISGFKIKWQAHPKRVNFDIHKVAGIISVVFLALIAFTGFCWNFSNFANPIIYAVTLSPVLPDPVSQPIPGKSSLKIGKILQKANAALPGAATTMISLPQKPESPFRIRKRFPQEWHEYGRSQVYLDQYTGKVIRVENTLKPSSLGDRVLNSFAPLHYGTFGGLPTRILYVFVGLSPTVLFITGFVMWRLRYKAKRIEAIQRSEKNLEYAQQKYSWVNEWPWF